MRVSMTSRERSKMTTTATMPLMMSLRTVPTGGKNGMAKKHILHKVCMQVKRRRTSAR
jgi:hypothetical protein